MSNLFVTAVRLADHLFAKTGSVPLLALPAGVLIFVIANFFAIPLSGFLKLCDGLWLYLLRARGTLVLLAPIIENSSMLPICSTVLLWRYGLFSLGFSPPATLPLTFRETNDDN